MSVQKILKVGNSLGVTLPSNFAKNLSLKPGDAVEVTQETGDTLNLTFIDSHQLSLGLNQPKKLAKKQI